MCPAGHWGRLVPYVFTSEEHTPNGQPISKKLAVTTKGYCFREGLFKKQPLRGLSDCLQLDLNDFTFGIHPSEEIIAWLDVENLSPQDGTFNVHNAIKKLSIRKRGKEDNEWVTVLEKHSTMVHFQEPEPDTRYEACVEYTSQQDWEIKLWKFVALTLSFAMIPTYIRYY